ncbi:MAG TPA: TIGR03016 family PEP-CTERM system-associated outer membrane protein [Aliidongia sp.]|nr:TIGR03016 family PEP-CTERM system-associated outer membrane protein [Aliidongia sp.]
MKNRPRRRAGGLSAGLTLIVGVGLAAISPSYGQEGPDSGEAPDNGVTVPIPPVVPNPNELGAPLPNGATPLPSGQKLTPYGQPVTPNGRTPIVPPTGTGFRVTVAGDLQETFTDNAFESVSDRKVDFLTTPGIDLTLHDDGAHFVADFTYSIAGDLYALNPSLDGLRQNLLGVARSELIPQYLALDARVFAQPVLVGRGFEASATERSLPSSDTAGYQDTYGYLIGPTLTNSFGTDAINTLSLQTGATFFSTPIGPSAPNEQSLLSQVGTAENTIVNTLTEKLASGPRFSQTQWDVLLQDTETSQESDNISDRVAQADLNYSLNRYIQLLSTFGYEQITDTQQLERNLSGPIISGGFRLTPGPRAELVFQGGVRNHEPTFSGNFRYDIGERSTLTASYTDQIVTEQQRLLGNLGNLGISPIGSPINTQTGQGFSIQPGDQLSLDNPLSRFRSLSATLLLHGLRTDYTATVFYTVQDTLTRAASQILPQQTATGGSLDISHQLTPTLTGDVNFSYSTGTGDVFATTGAGAGGGDDNTLLASAGLSYQINPRLSAQLRYSHLEQQLGGSSTSFSGTVVENAVVVSLRQQF